MPRQRYLSISDLMYDDWIGCQFKTGYVSPKVSWEVVSGVPKDAKLVDINIRLDFTMKSFILIYESPEFDDIEDIYSIPSMTVVAKFKEVKDGIQA